MLFVPLRLLPRCESEVVHQRPEADLDFGFGVAEAAAHLDGAAGEDDVGAGGGGLALCIRGGLDGGGVDLLSHLEGQRHAEDGEEEALQFPVDQVLQESLAEGAAGVGEAQGVVMLHHALHDVLRQEALAGAGMVQRVLDVHVAAGTPALQQLVIAARLLEGGALHHEEALQVVEAEGGGGAAMALQFLARFELGVFAGHHVLSQPGNAAGAEHDVGIDEDQPFARGGGGTLVARLPVGEGVAARHFHHLHSRMMSAHISGRAFRAGEIDNDHLRIVLSEHGGQALLQMRQPVLAGGDDAETHET